MTTKPVRETEAEAVLYAQSDQESRLEAQGKFLGAAAGGQGPFTSGGCTVTYLGLDKIGEIFEVL